MTSKETARFGGIYGSVVCPLNDDYSIDEAALAEHIADVAGVEGIVGILCNGHAGENFALSREEMRRVVEIAADTCGGRAIIVSGINAEDSRDAVHQARDAKAAGADAIMVFPPFSWSLSQDETMVLAHHAAIDDAVGMPMMLYQASVRSGDLAYRPEVLGALLRLPNVIGVKEGSWETGAYEANRSLVKSLAPHVLVMASGDEHLMTCFALGTEGSLVSLAALMPAEIVALYRAVERSDIAAARMLNDRIFPLARAIYGTKPTGRANTRLKMCLRLVGKLRSDRARTAAPIPGEEEAALRAALQQAELL